MLQFTQKIKWAQRVVRFMAWKAAVAQFREIISLLAYVTKMRWMKDKKKSCEFFILKSPTWILREKKMNKKLWFHAVLCIIKIHRPVCALVLKYLPIPHYWFDCEQYHFHNWLFYIPGLTSHLNTFHTKTLRTIR